MFKTVEYLEGMILKLSQKISDIYDIHKEEDGYCVICHRSGYQGYPCTTVELLDRD
jgi:hypothetical protein